MPRGRKRAVSGTLPSEKEGELGEPPIKREPSSDDVEEEFVEVELDETPSTSAIDVIESPNHHEDTSPAHLPKLEEDSTVKIGTKTTVVRKALPIPRLTIEAGRSKVKKPIAPAAGRARTRAQTMHQSVMEHVVKEESQDDHELEEEVNECELCQTPLNSKIELLEHKRAFHKDHVKACDIPTGSLICSHPHCSASFPNVPHLIAHLVAFHNQQQYRIRKITFEHIDRFEQWQKEMEKNARCVFLANQEPEGDSNDSYKIDMYCEFCDEWRNQDLREGEERDPHQVLRKVIGCPAHFTATIDNKKERAVVVGCFSHLGHHKKLTWSSMPNAHEGKPVRTQATTKCGVCGLVFRSRTAFSRHHRVVHEGVPEEEVMKRRSPSDPKMPSLECGDPECDVMCDSMSTLVQHVAQAHNRNDLAVEEYKFESLEDFEAWKTRVEAETCSRFCKVSGRVLANEVTKYFLCHLSGHTNRTKKKEMTPQDKQRNRPTKKMGRYCTAHMSFKLNRVDNTVTIRGCLGHFGHAFDVRRLPLPEQVRKEVTDLLLKGMVEEDIVHTIRSRYSDEERGYWLQRYEVRNIMLKLQREGLLLPKAFITPDDDGRIWDEMGFADESYVQTFVPIERPMRNKLVQYKPVRQGRSIALAEIGSSDMRTPQGRFGSRKLEPVEMVQFVDDAAYAGEELVEMRDIEEDVGLEDQVYYEQSLDGEDMAHEEEEEMQVASTSMPGSSRKRMPLLKEPMRTGNPLFDDVMLRMKDRFNKISHQLKCTQDLNTAHGLLKELKELQVRMGMTDGGEELVGGGADQWNEEYYDDEEFRILGAEVGHEEEVNEEEDGYEYIVNHPHDEVVRTEEVETEEIVS